MNPFDIVLLIVALVAAVLGWRRGLIAQIGSIFALIAGVVLCRIWGDAFTANVAPLLGLDMAEGSTAAVVAAVLCNILLFIIVYIIVVQVARLLRSIVHGVLLGPVDSLGGALFKMLKWMLASSAVLCLWAMISTTSYPATAPAGSATAIVKNLLPWLLGVCGLG